MLAHLCAQTVWAFGAFCPLSHRCHPDMRAACWTVGARPHNPSAAVWLHNDAAKQSIVVRVPLLLQLGLQSTNVWQAWLGLLVMLLCRLCCSGVAQVHKSCSKGVSATWLHQSKAVLCNRHLLCATHLTCLSLTICVRRQTQAASGMT